MAKRDCSFVLRLTEDELAHLNGLAKLTGYSREAYLRSLINGVIPSERPPPEYHAMANELHAIGNNLNQIARKAHVLGVIDAARFDEVARKLERKVTEIDEAVRLPRKL